MAGVADKARFYLERAVPQLREWEDKEIFSKVAMPIVPESNDPLLILLVSRKRFARLSRSATITNTGSSPPETNLRNGPLTRNGSNPLSLCAANAASVSRFDILTLPTPARVAHWRFTSAASTDTREAVRSGGNTSHTQRVLRHPSAGAKP
jgi:hypothetical protein